MILLAALLSLAGCASTTDKTAEAETAPVASVPQPATATAAAADTATASRPASKAAVAPSGWEELSQRMLAWGDPMRRSMEQYCPPQNTTSNP